MFFIYFLLYIHHESPERVHEVVYENTGRYRYKHKGSSLVRDALTAIGKAFTGTAKTAATKAAAAIAKKAGQRVGEIAIEKGSKRIQDILRKRK